MKSFRNSIALGLSLVFVVCIAGCGEGKPATAPVTGTVTLDGAPLDGASVTFTLAEGGRPATGKTDASGNFTLMTFEPGDGALIGSHKVSVTKIDAVASGGDPNAAPGQTLSGPPGAGGGKPKFLVPEKYLNPNTSGITVDVQAGMAPVTIELTSK